jgi:hypothetical protein
MSGDDLRWVLVDTSDNHVGEQFDSYQAAKLAAIRQGACRHAPPVAVVELGGPDEEALVWTPGGGEHAAVLTWPPTDKGES